MDIIEVRKEGLYCKEGDFYIDAWDAVDTNLVTHAHSDHAYRNQKAYIASQSSLLLLKHRLGEDIKIQTYPYNEKFKLKNCWISFHPAGHILGSSQIRIETKKEVCVVSGDYKRAFDATCQSFEVVPCDTFVTESTFALPIYRWESADIIGKNIYEWWMENRSRNLSSVIFCYALGKAQRIMSLLATYTKDPIYLHGAMTSLSEIYLKEGVKLPPFLSIHENKENNFRGSLILAPPSAKGSPWLRRFYPYKTAYASGWMQIRGLRKQKNIDKGFILSDHADWNELLETIHQTNASRIITTHGHSTILAKYLSEIGLNSISLNGMEFIKDEDK